MHPGFSCMDAALAFISLMYVMVWTVCTAAFIGLTVLVIMLCVPTWRRALLRHPRKVSVLGLLCLSVVGVTINQITSSIADTLARNLRLKHEVQVEGLKLPAGTWLHLMTIDPLDANGQPQIHGLASLDTARFPAPQTLMGARVSSLQMYHLTSGEMRLVGDQIIDGWPCARDTLLTVNFSEETRLRPDLWQFDGCTLVAGAKVAGLAWPTKSGVQKQGNEYSVSYWQASESVSIQGIELMTATVELDQQRNPLHWSGQLRNPMALGDWRYPRGTRAAQGKPQTLRMTSSQTYTAKNVRTGETLKPNYSILQRVPNGQVIWIKPNAEIDDLDW